METPEILKRSRLESHDVSAEYDACKSNPVEIISMLRPEAAARLASDISANAKNFKPFQKHYSPSKALLFSDGSSFSKSTNGNSTGHSAPVPEAVPASGVDLQEKEKEKEKDEIVDSHIAKRHRPDLAFSTPSSPSPPISPSKSTIVTEKLQIGKKRFVRKIDEIS